MSYISELYGDFFEKFCKELCEDRYLEFFSDPASVYMDSDGKSQPFYIGTAEEFCEYFTNMYAWQYVDSARNGTGLKDDLSAAAVKYRAVFDEGMPDSLTLKTLPAVEIVAVISVMFNIDNYCDGFMERCAKAGVLPALLQGLKERVGT